MVADTTEAVDSVTEVDTMVADTTEVVDSDMEVDTTEVADSDMVVDTTVVDSVMEDITVRVALGRNAAEEFQEFGLLINISFPIRRTSLNLKLEIQTDYGRRQNDVMRALTSSLVL